MNDNKGILIIIPTYNEKDNITPVLGRIYSLGISPSVLIVDDNSPDKTSEVIAKLQNNYPNLYLITRKRKMGLGSAYIEGFRYALNCGCSIVVQMDADLSHPPEYIPDMLKMLNEYELVIGSRYVKSGGVSGWPLHREWLSRFANIFSKTMLKIPVNDSTSGFKCMSRGVLEKVDFKRISARGYAFQIEFAYRALLKGVKLAEFPIVFYGRRRERSKMSLGIIIEAFFRIVYLSLESRYYKRYRAS